MTILLHPRSKVIMDDPRDPPHEPPYEAPFEGLPVLGHSDPIVLVPPHVLALQGSLPAEHCAACGQPNALHMDCTGCHFVGCHGVPARQALKALVGRPLRDVIHFGDPHPGVSSAVRDTLLVACGPVVSQQYELLDHEERINLSRRIAEIAVTAYLAEQAKGSR